ncbi:MAG: hypothetical protein ACXQT4_02510 [Methanotrichaceae archaeon]
MLDLDEIRRLLKDGVLLDQGYEPFCAEFEKFFSTLEVRDQKISETLGDLLSEVDDLIILAEELESDERCG